MLKRVLIAARGEIALRILRACRELRIDTVAACSQADMDSLPAQLAGQAVCIGPAPAAESYLNSNALLSAALASGCDAVHPGCGFLSESAEFAESCASAGLVFIGPSPETLRLAGAKAAARQAVRSAGVPIVPGSDGPLKSKEEALCLAQSYGWPVLLKACSGGGGRGIRPASGPEELSAAWTEAGAEALACFGDGNLYLEKLVQRPRHIEVQILADGTGHIVHLGERDCSLQRRRQKLVEETPAPGLPPALRDEICSAAVRAAATIGYTGAGTVEFLVEPDSGRFYFMELNARVQVEHGITEMVTDVDIVRQQLRIAGGLPLPFTQEDIVCRGHAIECRINAEDPARGFAPCPGTVEFLHLPGGPGIRVDTALFQGSTISPYYDSLAAKVMACAPTRLEAVCRMRRALEELLLEGFPTTAELCYELTHHPGFLRGGVSTDFLDAALPDLLSFHARATQGDA